MILGCFYMHPVSYDYGHTDRYEIRDYTVWKTAYEGSYSITHKQMLQRSQETLEDKLMNSFLMMYLGYRSGDFQMMESMLTSIDKLIEKEME